MPSKPDISAPGVSLNVAGFDILKNGTSYAAPQVAGAIALMCQQDSNLMYNPEAVKALLAANVSSSYDRYTTNPVSNNNLYTKYGAGILNCLLLRNSLRSERYIVDYFPSSSVIGDTRSFTIEMTERQIVRVAIAYMRPTYFTSNNHLSNSSIVQYDLPNYLLQVYQDSTYIEQTVYSHGNLKILEFTAPVTGTYTIKVQTRMNTNERHYYSVAWNTYIE